MSLKYPLPDYAASIWFTGDSINITFGNDQTVVIPIDRCGIEANGWGTPLPSQRGWAVILANLKDRAAASRDEKKIGQRGQPTQYEVERAMALDAKYVHILGVMAKAKQTSKEEREKAAAELAELGL